MAHTHTQTRAEFQQGNPFAAKILPILRVLVGWCLFWGKTPTPTIEKVEVGGTTTTWMFFILVAY